jgi:hypothetical protein
VAAVSAIASSDRANGTAIHWNHRARDVRGGRCEPETPAATGHDVYPVAQAKIHAAILPQGLAAALGAQPTPLTLPGTGRGCYIPDPADVLIGLHAYDSQE